RVRPGCKKHFGTGLSSLSRLSESKPMTYALREARDPAPGALPAQIGSQAPGMLPAHSMHHIPGHDPGHGPAGSPITERYRTRVALSPRPLVSRPVHPRTAPVPGST